MSHHHPPPRGHPATNQEIRASHILRPPYHPPPKGASRSARSRATSSPGTTYDSPSGSLSDGNHVNLPLNDDEYPSYYPHQEECPGASTTAHHMGHLSLDQHRHPADTAYPPSRGLLSASRHRHKRPASVQLNNPAGRQSPRRSDGTRDGTPSRNASVTPRYHRPSPLDHPRLQSATSAEGLGRRLSEVKRRARPFVPSHDTSKDHSARYDSGDDTCPSRMNTDPVLVGATVPPVSSAPQRLADNSASLRSNGLIQLPPNARYPGLILQPDSSPISQDQLAAEVKGIYAGIVMVEAKCINIDAAQAADPNSQLGAEQWQALIGLHRTLLYEHHDFLMATQYPSATPALRGLATKYSMPARMWKHGIHAFLEVLRHRRPESQDYMLAFIYLAYQMVALLYETVPSFTDTWIECLGDLARYRMAIEDEKEAHAIWGGVAARWYTLASDRHPSIGRLYHHLGILERPSLRKLCLYAKSLTCVVTFPNARDSLLTLFNPIVQDEQTVQSSSQSAEARIVTFHALVYTGSHERTISTVRSDALKLLVQQPTKLREFGAYFAITNTAAVCEFGSPSNYLAQQYSMVVSQVLPTSRPAGSINHTQTSLLPPNGTSASSASLFGTSFWIDSFNLILQNYDFATILHNGLGFLHVTLVFLHSTHISRVTWLNAHPLHTYRMPFDTGRLAWSGLAEFLNALLQHYPVTTRILECSRQGVFLTRDSKVESRPLCEDYMIRGLTWTQFYFPPGLFDAQCEDDGRTIETPAMQDARAERVLWLGLYLAFHTEDLHYDLKKRLFSACQTDRVHVSSATSHPPEMDAVSASMDQVSSTPSPWSRSRSSRTASSSLESEDGFTLVKAPSPQQKKPLSSHDRRA